jgi:PAS domain S-box-containing protein
MEVAMMARRILLVEDSQAQAEHIQLLLEEKGYRVDVANNGRKALEQVHAVPFDLILADTIMPEMDGYTLCQALKSDPQTKWMPFVFLSERRSELDIMKGLALGADNFIFKPCEDDHLVQRIHRIFEHLELRSQGYTDMKVSLRLGDRQVVITPDKQQIVELLCSTYEELCQVNARLGEHSSNLEAEVQSRTHQLREAEAKYRMLIEQLPAVTYIAAPDAMGHLLYVSPQIEPLLGFSVDEWLADPNLWTKQLHAADQQRILAEYARSIADRTEFSSEYRMLARDGHEVWVRAEATVIRDETGHPKFMQGIMFDITERKRAEGELAQQREALYQTEKVATMGQLLAGVAHELNNPLAVVSCYAELLGEQTRGGPLAERVAKINQAAQRCVRIVKSFLTLARQHPPERHEVQLNDTIKEAMELMAYPLRVDGVEVHINPAEELPPIWADPHQLHQVVVHLVSNAHQALRESIRPRQLTVSTCYDPPRSRVYLGVADTGPGIPPELQGRIFEPFFTTKPPRQGTGLGLPLCQGIIEAHGGAIRVESKPGEGTLFVVELPIAARPTGVPEGRMDDMLASPQAGAILVVDDEPEVANVLAELLMIDGHRVDTAANGAVALRKLQECAYDLILSDLRMPEMDGPGLYQALERHLPALSQRMIFMTGDALTPETQGFLAGTVVPSVSKPFSLEEIRRLIQQMLQARTT